MTRFFVFLSILGLVVTGCNKESSGTDELSSASVSVYAVVPDAPDLNFFLNGTNIATTVPFGSYTLYNRVKAGDVMLQAQSSSRTISIDTTFSTTANLYYSLFIKGSLSGIRTVVLNDFLPALTVDSCGLRFFVLSPGVSGINFHIVNKDSAAGTLKDWVNRSFSDNMVTDSINSFKKFAAGTYSFYAISSTNSKDTLARFTNKTFSDSSNYTLMLEGKISSGDTSLMLGTRLHNE